MDMRNRTDRVFCPVCGGKTKLQIREDKELKTILSTIRNANRKL